MFCFVGLIFLNDVSVLQDHLINPRLGAWGGWSIYFTSSDISLLYLHKVCHSESSKATFCYVIFVSSKGSAQDVGPDLSSTPAALRVTDKYPLAVMSFLTPGTEPFWTPKESEGKLAGEDPTSMLLTQKMMQGKALSRR